MVEHNTPNATVDLTAIWEEAVYLLAAPAFHRRAEFLSSSFRRNSLQRPRDARVTQQHSAMMSLPSYVEATRREEPWELIASWVTSHEKTVLCRVSKHFHTIFAASLWSEPTKVLLSSPDAIARLDAFIENAPRVRPDLLDLVVTMDLRALNSSHVDKGLTDLQNFKSLDYSKGCVIWLQKLYQDFPFLKFILFDGNPSFDLDCTMPNISPSSGKGKGRAAIQSNVKFSPVLDDGRWGNSSIGSSIADSVGAMTLSSLKIQPWAKPLLLSAVDCRYYVRSRNFWQQNVENLVFLDISGTLSPPGGLKLPAPVDGPCLPSLRVLKMRRLNLQDDELIDIIRLIGQQLFSLDVRENKLTGRSVASIIPLANAPLPRLRRRRIRSDESVPIENFFEDTPSYVRDESEYDHAGEEHWEFSVRPDDADGIMKSLMHDAQNSTGSLQSHVLGRDSQITKSTGLTHLYISGNRLTATDVWKLLYHTERLQVADFGSAPQDIPRSELSQLSLALQSPNLRFISQLRSHDVLKAPSSRRLQQLRIHHSLVTCTPTIQSIGDFYQSDAQRIKLAETELGTYMATRPDQSYAAFTPDMNPRLRILTLTDVPRKSSGLVVQKLTSFLQAASQQEHDLAYHQPPRHRRAPRILSGLRVLRLEFVAVPATQPAETAFSSVTGDEDADNFLAESSGDFSFFDEAPAPAQLKKVVSKGEEGLVDVREALRAFRRGTAGALERERDGAVEVAGVAPHSHWSGVLELVG